MKFLALFLPALVTHWGLVPFRASGFPTPEAGNTCITGSYLAFDVADNFAFDIDETVQLSFRLKANGNKTFYFGYDRNAQTESYQEVAIPSAKDQWNTINLSLKRARFSNRAQANTDFMMIPYGAELSTFTLDKAHKITVCDLKIERTYETPQYKKISDFDLKIVDSSGQIPVRMGLYDSTGRMPLPSDDAVSFQHYHRTVTQHYLKKSWGGVEPWPAENRHFFIVMAVIEPNYLKDDTAL
ncbi:hypothetical protein NO559_16390 [Dasania sp. GY-MA-18]|uniref:hypothetical protein n=1 Tax=Dasania sp. GY-MA-18 TaxID=2966584 RepID=UPI0021ACED4F|nr:hypothetical protein [Dasania sp. GY-MA-18]MCR8924355.1 hypothetical protein [Dasania sp. GY-MA-18]